MSLSFDVERCFGVRGEVCATCRRREPGSQTRQVYISPQWRDGGCPNYIASTAQIKQGSGVVV